MTKRKILQVDLSSETIGSYELDDGLMRKFVGGAGLAAKILYDETDANTQPLSADNPLIFMVGPLTGTPVPSANRYTVAAISPATGIYGEAHAGGDWAGALSRTGYLGMVIKGAASGPVYLDISDNGARIVDASHLWGEDTYKVAEILKAQLGQRTAVATIGIAGERLVNIAAIMSDGPHARAAGRTGMGAVMGIKKLKAVALSGTGKPEIHDQTCLKESIKRLFPSTEEDPARKRSRIMQNYLHITDARAGIKNFTLGGWPGFGEKMAPTMLEAEESRPCEGCRTSCVVSQLTRGSRHYHAEAWCPMGANCLIDDVPALYEAFDLCNRYGLDCISAGDIVAFAMELYEKGLISQADTGGIELKWGNSQAMIEMVTRMGEREGFGELLGQGVKLAAERIGPRASEYAVHVKGMETSLHDPRCHNAWALQNATASRGGDHMEGATLWFEGYQTPYLKSEEAKAAVQNRVAIVGMAELTAWSQDFDNLLDSLGVCKFLYLPRVWLREVPEGYFGVQPPHFLEWLNCVTGWRMDKAEFMRVGERIFTLKRLFNVRRGMSRKDDTLPPRLLTRKRGGEGYAPDNLPPLGALLNFYYQYRGWSEEGIPTKEKLLELGLEDMVGAE
ncbi:MAG: aldehyde ferredoxin oxidoreductase family protein [Chloroflexi bacterium]|nr:aldehyde ferredoxin oxidoreductase family protein [Chloroflexota bacterium]